jgi:hypothetical protein
MARTTTQFTLGMFPDKEKIRVRPRADLVCTIGIAPSRVSEARCDDEIWTCGAGMGV